MKPHRFKILVGSHIQNGKAYSQGKVVTSGADLTKLAANKFQDLGEAPDPVVKVKTKLAGKAAAPPAEGRRQDKGEEDAET